MQKRVNYQNKGAKHNQYYQLSACKSQLICLGFNRCLSPTRRSERAKMPPRFRSVRPALQLTPSLKRADRRAGQRCENVHFLTFGKRIEYKHGPLQPLTLNSPFLTSAQITFDTIRDLHLQRNVLLSVHQWQVNRIRICQTETNSLPVKTQNSNTLPCMYKSHSFTFCTPPKTKCGLHTEAFLHVSYGTRFKPRTLKTWARLIHGQVRYVPETMGIVFKASRTEARPEWKPDFSRGCPNRSRRTDASKLLFPRGTDKGDV